MVAIAAAGIAAAGAIGSSVISSQGASKAASQASSADMQAAQLAQQRYDQTRQDLMPYNQAGQSNLGIFNNFYKTSADQLGNAYNDAQSHIPIGMTQDELVNTPGYQFNLGQGMKAVQNSAAARGLGVSGSALKAAAGYATGLADSTYQQQFANKQQIYNDYVNQAALKANQLNTIYNQIGQPVITGENAGAQTGSIGAALAGQQASALGASGAAQAAGTSGAANAIGNSFTQIGNAGLNYLGLQNALNSENYGSGGGGGGYIDSGSWTY